MSSFGHPFHETPNFDALCNRGMRFTHAYSACTVCSPSRAAILTGQYPARTNLTDWIPGHEDPKAKLKIPNWHRQLDHQHITLPEALVEGGYRTGFFGKWHLIPIQTQRPAAHALGGFEEPQKQHSPILHGFDVNIGGREWGQPRGRGKYFYPFDMPGLEHGEEGEYLTDRLTEEAIGFIGKSSTKPFLLYMSYYSVHGPVMGKQADVAYFESNVSNESAPSTRKQKPAEYAAMHKAVDDSIGRIVEELQTAGELQNTIFIFTGDNGGDYHSACGGLRGYKGFGFEGGVRVPTCVVWPGVTQPGSLCKAPVVGTDFYPTILAMAGLPDRDEQHLDGEDLTPLLKQTGGLTRQSLFWHYPHYHRTKPYGAVRHGDWKLMEFFEDGQLMLFDLANDPNEERDLAQSKPTRASELLEELRAWRTEVGAQMPTPNSNVSDAG